MLSTSAFNALLKTLEEPPAHVKFIFATTEIRKVPVTVLSRCQRFDLRRIEPEAMLGASRRRSPRREGATVAPDALALITRAAEGSVRDALSLLDQAIAHGAGEATAAEVRAMLGLADRGRVLDLFEAVMRGRRARRRWPSSRRSMRRAPTRWRCCAISPRSRTGCRWCGWRPRRRTTRPSGRTSGRAASTSPGGCRCGR